MLFRNERSKLKKTIHKINRSINKDIYTLKFEFKNQENPTYYKIKVPNENFLIVLENIKKIEETLHVIIHNEKENNSDLLNLELFKTLLFEKKYTVSDAFCEVLKKEYPLYQIEKIEENKFDTIYDFILNPPSNHILLCMNKYYSEDEITEIRTKYAFHLDLEESLDYDEYC